MAVRGRYTTILVDGFDLSGQSNNVTIQSTNASIDVTPFQSASKVWLAEAPEGNIQHAGYFNSADAGYMEKVLYDRIASQSAYVTVLFDTTVTACPAYTLSATGNSDFALKAPVSGVITAEAKWMAGTGLKRGYRVFTGTISATGAQTGVDFLTPGAALAGGFAYLHVTAVTGTATNATVTVQSSAAVGFTSPTTHGTFTFSAIGGFAMSFATTVLRYIRINLTSLGGATDITCQAVVDVNGVTMT